MTKEKEFEFISKEINQTIDLFEKRDDFNAQLIDELDKQMTAAKYGSVGHVIKATRLSSLRNYRARLKEIIDAFKQIKDMKSLETIEGFINEMLEDSKTNFKNNTIDLEATEIFSNSYIKTEILVKTYKDLSGLYTEVLEILKKIKEGEGTNPAPTTASKSPAEQEPKTNPEKKI
jgi:hypothetical protein